MVHSSNEHTAASTSNSVQSFPCRSLDSLVKGGEITRVDYIKMDIEGGEMRALQGMLKTIGRFRPKLAIAIYHEPSHFFDIPEMLMKNLSYYRFYIRHYSYSRFETLIYAIPEEDSDGATGLEVPEIKRDKVKSSIFVRAYLQDAQIRLGYMTAPIRALVSYSGLDWQSAVLRTGPNFAAHEILTVEEVEPGKPKILSAFSIGERRIFVGEYMDKAEVKWLASKPIGSNASVAVVGHPSSTLAIGEYSVDTRSLLLYRVKGSKLKETRKIREIDALPKMVMRGVLPALSILSCQGKVKMNFVLFKLTVGAGSSVEKAFEWEARRRLHR